MRSSLGCALILLTASSGCEIVAKVDRDKIPGPEFMLPEASLPMVPGEDAGPDAGPADGGSLDAARGDSGPTDAGLRHDAAADAGDAAAASASP